MSSSKVRLPSSAAASNTDPIGDVAWAAAGETCACFSTDRGRCGSWRPSSLCPPQQFSRRQPVPHPTSSIRLGAGTQVRASSAAAGDKVMQLAEPSLVIALRARRTPRRHDHGPCLIPDTHARASAGSFTGKRGRAPSGMSAYSFGPVIGEGAAVGHRAGRTGATRTLRCLLPGAGAGRPARDPGDSSRRRPGLPLDEDEYLPGSNVACRTLPEPAQGQHAPAVPGDLAGRPARIGQVLLAVGDIEQVERVNLRLLICNILTLGQPIRPPAPHPARRSQCMSEHCGTAT